MQYKVIDWWGKKLPTGESYEMVTMEDANGHRWDGMIEWNCTIDDEHDVSCKYYNTGMPLLGIISASCSCGHRKSEERQALKELMHTPSEPRGPLMPHERFVFNLKKEV